MLSVLVIQDFILAKTLTLEFGPGFTVLTGETGAGKSLILKALAFVLGGRPSVDMVRAGGIQASITASFQIEQLEHLLSWLIEQDLSAATLPKLQIHRTLDQNGKSRAWVNQQRASTQQLRELAHQLIDLHSQQSHYRLLQADNQRVLLDHYAGTTALARETARGYEHWRHCLTARERALQQQQSYAIERHLLEGEIADLQPTALAPSEWEQLIANHGRLSNAAELQRTAYGCLDLLDNSENPGLIGLKRHHQQLSLLTEVDPALNDIVALLDTAFLQLHEASMELRRYTDHLASDPKELEQLDQRLAEQYALARRYRTTPDRLTERLQAAKARYATLEPLLDFQSLEAAVRAAEADFKQRAAVLSDKRRAAAAQLSDAVNTLLAPLGITHSRFEIALKSYPVPKPEGQEGVEYQLQHQGNPPRPLARIASGGELSRISLAIYVAMAGTGTTPTLVFDEVDVGIGGQVADKVGQLLRQLGRQRQLLSITHLPQVAARGDHHWQVRKSALSTGEIDIEVESLDHERRIDEIARMLGGASITATAREHAYEMLVAPMQDPPSSSEPVQSLASGSETRRKSLKKRTLQDSK